MIGKARRTTKLSVAIDPFTEVENLPLQLLAKASAALVAVQLLATLDFPALIGSYNAALATRPFTTKAAGTGITYFFSDLTAQALEGDRSSLIEKVKRASQFALVGALWVGPLLAAWFQVMDFYVPGRSVGAGSRKIVMDQCLQGPLMIATMFLWTGLLAGAGLSGALASIRGCLRIRGSNRSACGLRASGSSRCPKEGGWRRAAFTSRDGLAMEIAFGPRSTTAPAELAFSR